MDAKSRFTTLEADRTAVLERARKASELTLPGLVPPAGHTEAADLPTPYQSLGARGVNNLASKLLLALFPPATPFFRYLLTDKAVAEAGAKRSKLEEALTARERGVMRRFESTAGLRPLIHEVLKHLVVPGNALLYLPRGGDGWRMFRIDQFCVLRTPDGKPLEVVVKEAVSPVALPAETLAKANIKPGETKPLDLYTHIKWDYVEKRVRWHQELNGVALDTPSDVPLERCPWLPLRWNAVAGESYGRGLCVEYLGDLISYEELSKALTQVATAAARVVILVDPNGNTDAQDIEDAESGDAIVGREEDVSTLGIDKLADFQVTKAQADDVALRLSHAFLLQSGTIRDAERVTAEEIRQLAQELEDVLGGTYTVLAQELQLPVVKRTIADYESGEGVPPLPQGAVEPVIVTGFEALGRNHGINRLRAALADAKECLGEAALQAVLDADEVLSRIFSGHGLEDPKSLVKAPAARTQERQDGLIEGVGAAAAPKVIEQAVAGAQAAPQ